MVVTIVGTLKLNGLVFHAIETMSPSQNMVQAYTDNEGILTCYLGGSKCSGSAVEALQAIADNNHSHWATAWAEGILQAYHAAHEIR